MPYNLLVQTFNMILDEIERDKAIYYSKLIKNSIESNKDDRRYTFDYIVYSTRFLPFELLIHIC